METRRRGHGEEGPRRRGMFFEKSSSNGWRKLQQLKDGEDEGRAAAGGGGGARSMGTGLPRHHSMALPPPPPSAAGGAAAGAAASSSGKGRMSSVVGEKVGGGGSREYGRDHEGDRDGRERVRAEGYAAREMMSSGGGHSGHSVRDLSRESGGRDVGRDSSSRDASRDRTRGSARDDLSARDSSREGGYGKEKDRGGDRVRGSESAERGREKMEREREREKRERDISSRQQEVQRRHARGEIGEGDRPPPSGGSGSGTLSIPRSSVSPARDVLVDREGSGIGDVRMSGARQAGKDVDREPGELPSGSRIEEGSWRADVSISMPVMNSRNPWNSKPQPLDSDGRGGKRSPPKKRKFSPIVWDYDEKQARPNKLASVSGASSTSLSVSRFGGPQPSQTVLVQSSAFFQLSSSPPSNDNGSPPSVPPSSDRATPPGSGEAHAVQGLSSTPPESSPSPPVVQIEVSTLVSESSKEDIPDNHIQDQDMASPESDDEPEPGQLLPEIENPARSPARESPVKDDEEEREPPPLTIAASRWAEETHTPERDRSPRAGGGKGRKHRSSSLESEEGRVSSGHDRGRMISGPSTSPEPGEYIREKVDLPPRSKDRGNDSEGSVGQGSAGKGRRSNSIEDEEYERELNKRELMELDEEESGSDDQEEQRPEVEPDFEGVPAIPSGPHMRAIDMLQGCRSVDEFERLNRIDEGTYGVVYRARNKKTGEIVALKKVKMEKEKEGFPLTSLREINVLLSFHHPSVVDVKEVVVGSTIDSIFMVMEYMEHDLKGLMETMKQPFSQSEVKCLMLQLFEGVKYLHDNWVLHRDMKTSNLLLNNRGELKICDFGLARQYGSPLKPYTHMVVTLWYRAPELLLGAKNYQYSTAIDMWSLGCIMAELLAKEPLFNGKSEIDQIDKIFKTLGTPNEKIWPEFVKLPGVKCNFVRQPYNRLKERFPAMAFAGRPILSERGFDLLNKLLTYDPQKRITADEALQHDWFREVPLPKSKDIMPTFPARSEHDRRVRRLMKSPDPLEEQRKRELRQGELGGGGLFG